MTLSSRLSSLLRSANPFISPRLEDPPPHHIRIHLVGAIMAAICITVYSIFVILEYSHSPPSVALALSSVPYSPSSSPFLRLVLDGYSFDPNAFNIKSLSNLCAANTSDITVPVASLTSPLDPPTMITQTIAVNDTTLHDYAVAINVYGTITDNGNSRIAYFTYPERCYNSSYRGYFIIGVTAYAYSDRHEHHAHMKEIGGEPVYFDSKGRFIDVSYSMFLPSEAVHITVGATKTIDVDGAVSWDFNIGEAVAIPAIEIQAFGKSSNVMISMNPIITVQTHSKAGVLSLLGSISGAAGGLLLAWRYLIKAIIAYVDRNKEDHDNESEEPLILPTL